MHKVKVIEWLKDTDGYAVQNPQFFVELGFDPELVKRYVYDHGGGEGKHAGGSRKLAHRCKSETPAKRRMAFSIPPWEARGAGCIQAGISMVGRFFPQLQG